MSEFGVLNTEYNYETLNNHERHEKRFNSSTGKGKGSLGKGKGSLEKGKGYRKKRFNGWKTGN